MLLKIRSLFPFLFNIHSSHHLPSNIEGFCVSMQSDRAYSSPSSFSSSKTQQLSIFESAISAEWCAFIYLLLLPLWDLNRDFWHCNNCWIMMEVIIKHRMHHFTRTPWIADAVWLLCCAQNCRQSPNLLLLQQLNLFFMLCIPWVCSTSKLICPLKPFHSWCKREWKDDN